MIVIWNLVHTSEDLFGAPLYDCLYSLVWIQPTLCGFVRF